MAACGFTNGDVRLVDLETAEWSAPYQAHRQAVSAIYWQDQVVITGAADSSFIRWRYSKSKNTLQAGVGMISPKNQFHITYKIVFWNIIVQVTLQVTILIQYDTHYLVNFQKITYQKVTR